MFPDISKCPLGAQNHPQLTIPEFQINESPSKYSFVSAYFAHGGSEDLALLCV